MNEKSKKQMKEMKDEDMYYTRFRFFRIELE